MTTCRILLLQCGAFGVGKWKSTGLTSKEATTQLNYTHDNLPEHNGSLLPTFPCFLGRTLPALIADIFL